MKIRIVFGCLSIVFWLLLFAWTQVGCLYYSKGKVWNGNVIEEPVTYAEFVENKTELTWGAQMFFIAALAGGFQFLAMRTKKERKTKIGVRSEDRGQV